MAEAIQLRGRLRPSPVFFSAIIVFSNPAPNVPPRSLQSCYPHDMLFTRLPMFSVSSTLALVSAPP